MNTPTFTRRSALPIASTIPTWPTNRVPPCTGRPNVPADWRPARRTYAALYLSRARSKNPLISRPSEQAQVDLQVMRREAAEDDPSDAREFMHR